MLCDVDLNMGRDRSECQSPNRGLCLDQPVLLGKSYLPAHIFDRQAILFHLAVFELIAQLDIPGQRILELCTGHGVCC